MKTVLQRMFEKPLRSRPPGRIVNPWPDGAKTVNIYLYAQIGDLRPGRYSLSRQAYVQGDEPKYTIYGQRAAWTESSLRELVVKGDILVLPD